MTTSEVETKAKISVIITAGGVSNRFGSNKLLQKIGTKPQKTVIQTTIDKFLKHCDEVVVATTDDVKKSIKPSNKIVFAPRGATRQKSVHNALKLCGNPDYVLIHDGARPFIDEEIIKNVIEEVQIKLAVVVGVRAIDTVKVVDNSGKIISTPKRETLFYAQTPQAFEFSTISKVHIALENEGAENFTDDASMLEFLGHEVYVIEGNYKNKKITTMEDLH